MALQHLNFDNRFLADLPVDPISENHRRQVNGACSSRVRPTAVAAPQTIAVAKEVAELLDLSAEDLKSDVFTQAFVGNALLNDMDPYACCYGGHQFGHWAGQLGDGRAINLGEIVNKQGERWAMQLKGAGPTPYSRSADGLAVLRSSVREFVCSEAMHHLGVPTTRALSLILTGEQVMRDILYDGHPKYEPGAVVCRVAPSFTRFGSFQIHASRGDIEVLKQLVDYTIKTDFPHLGLPSKEVYIAWFGEVVERTALMIVEWMRVGFVHGVMNTDNMSILGLTIDYGPYGWLEPYDPDWTPNTTDAENRRYRFGQQPQIAHWNLVQLAESLISIIGEVEPLQEAVNGYPKIYQATWRDMMAQKLGLDTFEEDDTVLFNDLHETLQIIETDMTLFFRALANYRFAGPAAEKASDAELVDVISEAYYEERSAHTDKAMTAWLRRYSTRLDQNKTTVEERASKMNSVNPQYVLRNYLAQLAIDDAEKGDFALVNELLDVLRNPYSEQAGKERFAEKRPEWARNRAGCSMLSCSS